MLELGLPALFTLALWWASTGLILHLDGLRRETFRWSMAGATALLALGLLGLREAAEDTSMGGAYLGFTCALLVWGWIELAFLTGWVTGPRKLAAPPGIAGWPRLRAALAAILWHELAILALGAAILAIGWGAPNQVGSWTFLVLWGMRTSAKLNVFLGVRNLGEAFLPDHLRYLGSHFVQRPMNLLFPVSVTVSTLVAARLFHFALAPDATPGEATGFALAGTLMALAVLEHWFLVLPIPVEQLWSWSMRGREATAAPNGKVGTAWPVPIAKLRQGTEAT